MKLAGPSARWILVCGFLIAGHLSTGQPGTGIPFWVISPTSSSGAVVVDWRMTPPGVDILDNSSPSLRACAITAVNKCGEPLFHVKHSGQTNVPDNLFIYDPDGNPLLDNSTGNGPGLNAKAWGPELQVINVPGSYYEWFIIYPEFMPNNGAPLNDGTYSPAHTLYSRISYRCGSVIVLERDVPLTVSGTAYTYNNSKAISFLPGNPTQLCLYTARRTTSGSTISIDRFLIKQTGIEFDRNTGNVPADNWVLSVDGAALEVSPDGLRIAMNNRDQSTNGDNILLFDAAAFDNNPADYQSISINDLILQPDNLIVFSAAPVYQIASDNPDLYFLSHIESKIYDIEFSPDGEYLYFTNGGFVNAGLTCTTYLGQIELGPVSDPSPYPYNLRLQIQVPPGPFDPVDGNGGNESQYPDTYHPVFFIKKTYNNAIYFIKRNTPYLFSIPFPDEPIPQSLVPGEIDLSDADHPNIQLQGKLWFLPDQIDGYDYITSVNPSISLGNDTTICEGDQIALTPGASFISWCWNDGSTDSVLHTGTAGTYWVEVIDEFGCFAYDTVQIETLIAPSVSLGDDYNICPGDSAIISPGNGFAQYLWQDGSTNPEFLARDSGMYWVEVSSAVGCSSRDTLVIGLSPVPEFDFGQDTIVLEPGNHNLDSGPGFDSYLWQDGSHGRYFEVPENGLYWVTVSNGYCFASDTVYVILNDCSANLQIPNCFTPNSDGYNDVFMVSSQNLSFFSILIYNRWGELLFETEDPNNGWDGKVNGNICPIGTYFYLIKFSTPCSLGIGQSGVRKGSVTLLE